MKIKHSFIFFFFPVPVPVASLSITSSRRGLSSRVITWFTLQTIAGNYTLSCQALRVRALLPFPLRNLTPVIQFATVTAAHLILLCVCVWGCSGAQRFALCNCNGLTLNIQQLSSTAPEHSSNYRSSLSYLHLSSASLWFLIVCLCFVCVWERNVLMGVSGNERKCSNCPFVHPSVCHCINSKKLPRMVGCWTEPKYFQRE